MTTDIERQFFDTFGIEPIKYCKRCCWCKIEETTFGDYDMCLKPENGNCLCFYPQITDRILLELICMLSKTLTYVMLAYNIDELKQYVLSSCIRYSESIDKHQVQALFKGE